MCPNVFLLHAAKINGNAGSTRREHRKISVLQSCPAILLYSNLRLACCIVMAFYFCVSQMSAQAQEFSIALFQGLELAHLTGSMHKEQHGGGLGGQKEALTPLGRREAQALPFT